MGFNRSFIYVSLLLVSVGASRYDQGPQKFYDVTSDSETAEQNQNKEVILYLTPEQVRALETDGAVVQSAEDSENDEADNGLSAEQQVNENQEETSGQDEIEDAQEQKEAQQEEQENPEDILNQDIDFEEILRILNEEQVEEEEQEEAAEEQARNEPQVEEENTESPRNFSPRITLRQQLQQQPQEERYIAPAVAKKEQILKSYSLIRYQPNEQRQINVQLLQQQSEEANKAEESSEEPQSEAPTQEKKKYKLIPYEVVETPASEDNGQEQSQQVQNAEAGDSAQRLNDFITPLVNVDRLTGTNRQRKNRIQSILRELKASSKYNDQTYAIEIERLRANLEKQNAASKAETIAKVAPSLIYQQLNKKVRLNKSKQGKEAARNAESQKPQQSKVQRKTAFTSNVRPIAVPVMRAENPEVLRPIPVPVETSKRVSVKNVYVKTRTDKPFIISRRVPENKRQNPVDTAASKPERITILRHIWEH